MRFNPNCYYLDVLQSVLGVPVVESLKRIAGKIENPKRFLNWLPIGGAFKSTNMYSKCRNRVIFRCLSKSQGRDLLDGIK